MEDPANKNDYFNIIYFTDSQRTKSLRFSLRTFRVAVVVSAMFVLLFCLAWVLLSVSWLENNALRQGLLYYKKNLFEYQVRHDSIFDIPQNLALPVDPQIAALDEVEEPNTQDRNELPITQVDFPVEVVDFKSSYDLPNVLAVEFGVQNKKGVERSVGKVWAVLRDVDGGDVFYPEGFDPQKLLQTPNVPGYAISRFKAFRFDFDAVQKTPKSVSINIQDVAGGHTSFEFQLPSIQGG